MRTKTLALSTLLGALGSATSLLAQVNVYSINAVGYVNTSFPKGYSILTCPLIVTGGNTLNNLFPPPATVPSGGSPLYGAQIAVFSGGHFGAGDSISYSGGWNSGGTITINPGQAVFFQNPNSTPMTATFVGTVPQNGQYNMTNTLIPGYNLVGSIVPVTGTFISPIINLSNSISSYDEVLYFNSGTQAFAAASQGSYSLGWSTPPASPSVTEGFYYYNSTAIAGTGPFGPITASNEFWVENFTINP